MSNKRSTTALLPLSKCLAMLMLASTGSADEFTEGQQALAQGRPDAAVSYFEQSVRKRAEGSEEYLRDLFWLSRAQHAAGETDAANENLQIYWDLREDIHPSMVGKGSAAYQQWLAEAYRNRFGREMPRPVSEPVVSDEVIIPRSLPAANTEPKLIGELLIGAEDLDDGADGTMIGLRVGYEWPSSAADNRRWYGGLEMGANTADADLSWFSAVAAHRWTYEVFGQQVDVGPLAGIDLVSANGGDGFGIRLGGEAAWRKELSYDWHLRAGLGLGYRYVNIDGDDSTGPSYYALVGAMWTPSWGSGGSSYSPSPTRSAYVPPASPSPSATTPPASSTSTGGVSSQPISQPVSQTSPVTSTSSRPAYVSSSGRGSSAGSSGSSYRSSGGRRSSSGRSPTGLTIGMRTIDLEGDRNSDGEYVEVWLGWAGHMSSSSTWIIALGYGEAEFDNFERDTQTLDYEMGALVYDIAYRQDIFGIAGDHIAIDWEIGGGMSIGTGANEDDTLLGFHARGGLGFGANYQGIGIHVGAGWSYRYYDVTPSETNLDIYDFTTSGLELNVELSF